jgi:hypothetical protein
MIIDETMQPQSGLIKLRPSFTLGIEAKVELKSSIPIGAITEISPKSFTLGVKADEI